MDKSFVQRKIYNWLQRETGSSGVRKVASLRGAIASEIGNVRSDNQDKAIIFKGVDAQAREYAVAVVADGIGGMNDGAACAALSIASFASAICELSQRNNLSPAARMVEAANYANEAVYRDYLGRGGSTLVAVMFSAETRALWVSAGDSRIYFHSRNSLKLLTTDDTIAGQLKRSGAVPAEHSKILQFVGMGKDLEPHLGDVDGALAGQLILTTDGVHYLENGSDWFKSIIQNAPDAGATAKRLVEVAKWCGGPDNATIACIGVPFQPSERHAVGDGIQIWDAFGELDIQLPPNLTTNRQQGTGVSPKNSIQAQAKVVDDDVEPQLIEEEERELLPPTGKTISKATPKKPKKSRAKKPTDNDTPQLDIEFSKKE